jgi:amidase
MPTIFKRDTARAFCVDAPIEILSTKSGPLKDLTFGVKDIFDIANIPTAFGSPAWLNSHPIPTETATFISSLVDAGASLVGKTHTDELTYSILGMNAHYGTPLNTVAPNRVPGGSSSGSASAVAANLVDFAIGSDTGGSVRAPASFCGIYGFRPTHGRISLERARPLAKSFDTLGWFARDPEILLKVGEVLFNETRTRNASASYFFLKEAFDLLPPSLSKQAQEAISLRLGRTQIPTVEIGNCELKDWAETFRIIQAGEIWEQHGNWASEHLSEMGPGVKDRFEAARSITEDQKIKARSDREKVIAKMAQLLSENTYLILPTVFDIAPRLDSSAKEFDDFRKNSFQLLCIAGLCGLPQVTLPLLTIQDAPFGVSILAKQNMDMSLLGEIYAPT